MPRLFGEKLRYIRHLSGLTQGELARQLSLASYAYINRLEANERTPALLLVLRTAMLFDLPSDYFLRDSLPPKSIESVSLTPLEDVGSHPKLFGTKLQALRRQAGWDQSELAQKLGLARQGYISNLELGRKLPSLDLVVQIADLFSVTTDYLLRDTFPLQSYPTSTEQSSL
jgi:transcriptional regulator with XRE-family HTH domain